LFDVDAAEKRVAASEEEGVVMNGDGLRAIFEKVDTVFGEVLFDERGRTSWFPLMAKVPERERIFARTGARSSMAPGRLSIKSPVRATMSGLRWDAVCAARDRKDREVNGSQWKSDS
jgi:hypothetical protein